MKVVKTKIVVPFMGLALLGVTLLKAPSLYAEAKPEGDGRPIQRVLLPADQWLDKELKFSLPRIYRNISPADARPGAVIAAQTRQNPDYYYHWTRDAALTMEAVVERYKYNQKAPVVRKQEQQVLKQKLMEYFDFSDYVQNVSTLTGLGEPKFRVDGSAYNEPWGRPQNDGPALRAVSFIQLAQILIAEGKIDFVRTHLYNPKEGVPSVIKRDLEYVSHRWRDANFDLWEEVKGDHFYTRMVQRRALREGADLASTLGDRGAAEWYAKQAVELEKDLWTFWDSHRGIFTTTKNRVGGIDYKHSQLDTAFVLALLHGNMKDGFLPFSDARVQSTMDRISESFYPVYAINRNPAIPGQAMGRYPEDRYSGIDFNGGNPWVLTTLAFAEAYYLTAAEYFGRDQNNQAQKLIEKGDRFVMRVQYHAHDDGSLNEQIDRNTGFMTSVEDLTWNYGAILTTYLARQKALKTQKGSAL